MRRAPGGRGRRGRTFAIVPAALAAAVVLAGCGGESTPAGARPQVAGVSGEAAAAAQPGDEAETPPQLDAQLWFPDSEGNLAVESRSITREPTPALQARALVQALVAGPLGDLTAGLPPDAAVRALHLDADGTVYLDMNQAFAAGLSSGSEDALLAVRSIVQTLAANVPEVRRVKFLVEGEETTHLGGHLDLSRPLEPEGAPR
jgi:spore germination protein GerM